LEVRDRGCGGWSGVPNQALRERERERERDGLRQSLLPPKESQSINHFHQNILSKKRRKKSEVGFCQGLQAAPHLKDVI
jgi:hypothetical protein